MTALVRTVVVWTFDILVSKSHRVSNHVAVVVVHPALPDFMISTFGTFLFLEIKETKMDVYRICHTAQRFLFSAKTHCLRTMKGLLCIISSHLFFFSVPKDYLN